MRTFLLVVIGLNLFFLSHGQTNVSGNITSNTSWTKANLPYVFSIYDSVISLSSQYYAVSEDLVSPPVLTSTPNGRVIWRAPLNQYAKVAGKVKATDSSQDYDVYSNIKKIKYAQYSNFTEGLWPVHSTIIGDFDSIGPKERVNENEAILLSASVSNTNPELQDLTKVETMVNLPASLEIPIFDADFDPTSLKIDELPDWLSLKVEAVFEAKTVVDMNIISNPLNVIGGHINDARIGNRVDTDFAYSDNGDIYFINYFLYHLSEDNLQVLSEIPFELKSTNRVEVSGDVVYVSNQLAIYRQIEGEWQLFAGSDVQGDVDGIGSEARFKKILEFISDGNGGFYILDEYKIKHVNEDGIVTTVAGNGNYRGSEDGIALEVPLGSVRYLQLYDESLYFLENYYTIKELKNGQIKTIFPTANAELVAPIGMFNVDRLGNIFVFFENGIYIYDSETGLLDEVTAVPGRFDGVEGQFGWGSLSQLNRSSSSAFTIYSPSYGDVIDLTYNFKYTLVGTPPEGSEGTSTLTFKLSDGYGEEQLYEVPLTVLESDIPIVSGLPQSFSFDEDASSFLLDPIVIETDDQEEIFEVKIQLSQSRLGALSSSLTNLEDSFDDGFYFLSGNQIELNELLSTISFKPGLNNDQNGKIVFEIIRKNGWSTFEGEVGLEVNPINDAPVFTEFNDVVAYVGDSLILPFEISDAEDGFLNSNLEIDTKPDWLSFAKGSGEDKLLAGVPGGIGIKLGKSLESNINNPLYLTQNHFGEILFTTQAGIILKIDQEGNVVHVAGTGKSGYLDGPKSEAQFNQPMGIATDSKGNIYVADQSNNVIRKIDSDGVVTTIAGSGDQSTLNGIGPKSSFNRPKGISISKDESTLFISEDNAIRILTIKTRGVFTIYLSTSGYNVITGAFESNSGDLYVTTYGRVYKYTKTGQNLGWYVGRGIAEQGYQDGSFDTSRFGRIGGLVEDELGNIYIIESNLIRKVDAQTREVTTVIGYPNKRDYKSGINSDVNFQTNGNIIWDGEYLIFADGFNNVIRKVKPSVNYLSGAPQLGDIGKHEVTMTVKDSQNESSQQDFYIDVFDNDRLDISGIDTLLFVDEKATEMKFSKIVINSDSEEDITIQIELGEDNTFDIGTSPENLFEKENGRLILNGSAEELNQVLSELKLYSQSFEDITIKFSAKLTSGILKREGNILVIANPVNDLPELRSQKYFEVITGEEFSIDFDTYDVDSEIISTTLQNLPSWVKADSIRILQPYVNAVYSENLPDSIKQKITWNPRDMVKNSKGEIFFSDTDLDRIFKLDQEGQVVLYAGSNSGFSDGDKKDALFERPKGLAIDNEDNLYVADYGSHRIRKIDSDGNVTTIVGDGTSEEFLEGYNQSAKIYFPEDLAFDKNGNLIIGMGHILASMSNTGYVSKLIGQYGEPNEIDGFINEARIRSGENIFIKGDSIFLYNNVSRKLRVLVSGQMKTISKVRGGSSYVDSDVENSTFDYVTSVTPMNNDQYLVTDGDNAALRLIDFKTNEVATLIGKGYPGDAFGDVSNAELYFPMSTLALSNNEVLIGDVGQIKRLAYTVPKISGTPQLADIGEHKFTLRISDGKDGIIEEEITINVIAPNMQPEVLEISDIEDTYSEDGSIEVSLFDYFSDFENTDSELTYELISNTDNSVVTSSPISSVDGLLKLVVVNAGTTTLTVGATDSEGASVNTSFEVAIAKAEAMIQFGTLSFINTGEAKEIAVTTVPSELNYTITYAGETTAPSSVGKYAVVVTIDERNYAKEATAELEIVNVAPEGMALSNDQIIENSGSDVIGNLSVTDQNPTDEHTFSLVEGEKDNVLFSISENVLSSNSDFNYEEASSYIVSIKVEDNYGGSLVKELTISVVDINESPTIDAYDEIQIVKNLGSLSINLTGLSAGEEANQTISLSTTNSAFIKSSTVTLNADGTSATLVFETEADQEGEASIQVTVKDNGGTSNGGVDIKTIEIPIKISAPNISVDDGSNCGPGEVTMTASGANQYKWYSAPLDGSLLFEGSDFTKEVESSTEFFVAGVFNGVESKLRVPVKAVIFDELQAPQVTNNSNVLSVTSASGISYQWFNNEEGIDGATSNSFTPTETGNYSVRISNENGCVATSAAIEVVIAGIDDEYFELGVNIYPVPTSDYVYLEFSETLKKGAVLRLIDVSGKELVIYTSQAPTNKLTLDVSKVMMGMHTLIIVDGNRIARKKILIQR
jgi:hypothetical protein